MPFGIKIDGSRENDNTYGSMQINHEFDLQMIEEKDVQYEDHFENRISTLLRIEME
jgi:hypothetical protein